MSHPHFFRNQQDASGVPFRPSQNVTPPPRIAAPLADFLADLSFAEHANGSRDGIHAPAGRGGPRTTSTLSEGE